MQDIEKTYQNILGEMLSRVPDTLDKREGSMIQTALGPVAWYLEGIYLELGRAQQNVFADTAGGISLDRLALERGIKRKKAIPAVKLGRFDVEIPIGSRFSALSGQLSLKYAAKEFLRKENERYFYAMECEKEGSVGNGYVGTLIAIDYVNGLTEAQLTDVLVSGSDEEGDEELRERYFTTFEAPSFCGNISSYRNEILKIEGVGAVQIYPAWKGGGTVLCSILGRDYLPADKELIHEVQSIICPVQAGEPSRLGLGLAPIGGAVTIVTGSEAVLSISCKVQFSSSVADQSPYQDEIKNKIAAYFSEVRKDWGSAIRGYDISYVIAIYLARISSAILTVSGVVNVTDIMMNGAASDYVCNETSALQEVPVLGEVVIHGVN